jgi:NAD(P)-dependent dehydrogenase (short-subunit alcohol dehydrogenase family)
MFDFNEQVVVISGAAGNLGSTVAHTLDEQGAKLGLLDRRPGRLQKVCGKLAENPDHLLIGSVDMTQPGSVDEACGRIIEKHGRIDVLINALGGYRAGKPVHETSEDDWDFMFDLNVRSTFLACKAAVPHMLRQQGGKIVNIAARPGLKGVANAVIRLTESLAAELKHQAINVNCVLPGTLDTPDNREQQPDADFSRWVSPQQVTEVILFLASDAAEAVHGASMPAYGTG